MDNATHALLICDSVAWRLDALQPALERVEAAARAEDPHAALVLGYRRRDDLLLVALQGPRAQGALLAERCAQAARLAGLRAFAPPGPVQLEPLAQKALHSCEIVLRGLPAARLVEKLRVKLAGGDERRGAQRLKLALPLRYKVHGRWMFAQSRDVSGAGIFVETAGAVPEVGAVVEMELQLPAQEEPLRLSATVVRQTPQGFGVRLRLSATAEERLFWAVRQLQAPAQADARRRDVRHPAQLEVKYFSEDEVAHAWTRDISRGGLFLETARPPPIGTVLRIRLHLPHEQEVELSGRVVRVVSPELAAERRETPGCGVSLLSLSDFARERLEGFVSTCAPVQARVLLAAGAPLRYELRDELQGLRCEVLDVDSAADAFRLVAEELLSLDLLVADEQLADGPALDLLHRLRLVGGETELPVVLLGRDLSPAASARFLAAGADETVLRDAPPHQLARTLLRVLTTRRRTRK